MTSKENLRVLSGIQPSGILHLGNYFGMMSRMIDYQKENDLFCFIANYHALTIQPQKDELSENTFYAACDFLALGIDPEKSTFWVQSDVPQVTELAWIISPMASVGLMDRSTSYKDKIAKGINSNMGLFSYPMLMAADILCFDTQIVPVGKDQKQHLEITRDIANRFNHNYGDILIVPDSDIEKSTQLIPGIDGQKMSKSYNNTIPIFANEKVIRKQVMSIVTDATPIDEPKNKETTLFELYSLFLDITQKKELTEKYDGVGLRYGDIKGELYDCIMDYFSPFRLKRDRLVKNKKHVLDLLHYGAEKASETADEILDRVRSAIGIKYN